MTCGNERWQLGLTAFHGLEVVGHPPVQRVAEGSSGVSVLCGETSGFFAVATGGHDAPAAPSGGIEEQPSTAGARACADATESRRCEEFAG